jgi:hypothetical protein
MKPQQPGPGPHWEPDSGDFMWEVGSLLRFTDAGAPATREVAEATSRRCEAVAPANQAALHNSKLLEKEYDNAERGRDFRLV